MKTKQQLHLGFDNRLIDHLPKSEYLFIGDELPHITQHHRVFDYKHDSVNPIKRIAYKDAKVLARTTYAVASPEGENTLTVRGGKRSLAKLFRKFSRLDKIEEWLVKQAEDNDLSAKPPYILFRHQGKAAQRDH